MRYVLIGLGLITFGLAAALAAEGLWWAALPDGAFGAGVAWVAFASLRGEQGPASASAAAELEAGSPPRRAAQPRPEEAPEPAPIPGALPEAGRAPHPQKGGRGPRRRR